MINTQLRGTIFGMSKTGLSWLKKRLSFSKNIRGVFSPSCLVSTATTQETGRTVNQGSIPGTSRYLLLLHSVQTDFISNTVPGPILPENRGSGSIPSSILIIDWNRKITFSIGRFNPGHRVFRIYRIWISASARTKVDPEELSITSYPYRKLNPIRQSASSHSNLRYSGS